MGVVAVVGVVGVVYEQEVQVVRGYWTIGLGWTHRRLAHPAPPVGPMHPLRPYPAISELASQLYLRGETWLIHISKARECVERVLPSLVSTAI